MEAVKEVADAIKFINDPYFSVAKHALDTDYRLISKFARPSVEIQKYAISKNPFAIFLIKKPSSESILYFKSIFDKMDDKQKKSILTKLQAKKYDIYNVLQPKNNKKNSR